jgi:very-short-patch-repair endonuclease
MYCIECDCSIQKAVFNYSIDYFGVPLCIPDQKWIKQLIEQSSTTGQALVLYFLLKENGVDAELEKYDGHKCVDIVIESAKVHIEVDGGHHNYSSKQALADLKRTFFSFKKGYITLRIPNSLINNDAEETADYITDFLEINQRRISKRRYSPFKFAR